MLSISTQLETGRLVSPESHRRLARSDGRLVEEGGDRTYPLVSGVPILLSDEKRAEYGAGGEAMLDEYERIPRRSRLLAGINRLLAQDFLAPDARASFERVIGEQGPDALCLSVGGGPTRAHPKLINLNIGPFDNVDVVGDAYALPYADGAVDAIHCNAVLEHLEFPERAVAEMYRVLRAGGRVFAQTPFLQAYHGYPHHFQNFTLEGHDRLFERAGFEIVASGAAVGPMFALTDLISQFVRAYLPGRLAGRIGQKLVQLVSLAVRPFDRLLFRHRNAANLASCVFLEARKPGT